MRITQTRHRDQASILGRIADSPRRASARTLVGWVATAQRRGLAGCRGDSRPHAGRTVTAGLPSPPSTSWSRIFLPSSDRPTRGQRGSGLPTAGSDAAGRDPGCAAYWGVAGVVFRGKVDVKPIVYNLLYRFWAPWDAVGVREDLETLLASERVDAERFPRALDLGCGTGANVVHLAQRGFEAFGVDFSPVALEKARARADAGGVSDRCHWVEGDLTAPSIDGLELPFDFLTDFGTLDDLQGDRRRAMASLIASLARPGALFLEWCFYGKREDLPRINFSGPAKVYPGLEPGEIEDLFQKDFAIEPYSANPGQFVASFLLTRR